MPPRFEIRIDWDSNGYYVTTVAQVPSVRMEGPSPDDLAVERREALRGAFRLEDPPDDPDIVVVRSP